MNIYTINDERVAHERILNLVTDVAGDVYGLTKSGAVFRVTEGGISDYYESGTLGLSKITCIIADPENAGELYYGTSVNSIYHGRFGDGASNLTRINTGDASNINCMYYGCGRLWLATGSVAGYIDENDGVIKYVGIVYGDSKKVCAAYIALWGVYDPETKKHRTWTADDIRGDLLTDLILSFATRTACTVPKGFTLSAGIL